MRAHPRLSSLNAAATRELVLAAQAAHLAPGEWSGFLAALERIHGDLHLAAQALGSRSRDLPRQVALNPEYRSAMEALRRAEIDGAGPSMRPALHAAALAEGQAQWGVELRRRLGLTPAAALAAPPALEWIEPVRLRAEETLRAATAADQALAQALARFGPALTPAQRAAVNEAHRTANAALYDARDAGARALGAVLERSTLPPESLLAGYEVLAATPLAETALRWASSQAQRAASPLGGAEALERVAALAAENAAAGLIARAPTATGGVDAVAELLLPFGQTDAKRYQLAKLASVARVLGTGDLRALGAFVEGTLSMTPAARALQVTGLLAAAASAASEVQQGELTRATRALALTGLVGYGLLKGTAASLANAAGTLPLTRGAALAATAAEWATRLLPGIVGAFYVSSIVQRVEAPEQDLGTALSAVGLFISLSGYVAGATGAGAPAGAVLTAGGFVVSAVGDAVSASASAGRTAQADLQRLELANEVLASRGAPRLAEGVVESLSTPGFRLGAWGALEIGPERLQALLVRFPSIASLGAARARDLLEVARDLNVREDELGAFLAGAIERYGSLGEGALALAEQRASRLQGALVDPSFEQELRDLARASSSPEQGADAVRLRRAERSAELRASWAAPLRRRLGLAE